MRGFFKWLRLNLNLKSQEEREYDYLCEATDTIDLEARQRRIDRGTWR